MQRNNVFQMARGIPTRTTRAARSFPSLNCTKSIPTLSFSHSSILRAMEYPSWPSSLLLLSTCITGNNISVLIVKFYRVLIFSIYYQTNLSVKQKLILNKNYFNQEFLFQPHNFDSDKKNFLITDQKLGLFRNLRIFYLCSPLIKWKKIKFYLWYSCLYIYVNNKIC